jgi:hypothetical protein
MSRSLTTLPNNSGTTSITEVYSATGFSAGDPVYFQNGDYKNPANLTPPSAVNFSFPEAAAINPYGTGGTIAPSFTYAQMQTGMSGGTSRRFAAVLTNGNIVQAFSSYAQAPTNSNLVHFRIVNSTGAVVVSPTLVSSLYETQGYACVSVVALTGGGFAVGWLNSGGGTANSVNYAIYSNTGSLVTAATQDTSFATTGATYVPLEMTNLANGGFAIAVKNTSSQIFLRAYSATGVGAYAAVNVSITAAANENSFALTARSDNSVFICDRLDGTRYVYALFNSSGTAIVSPTNFSLVGSLAGASQGFAGPDASVQTDGTTIVIAFNGHNGTYGYPSFRFLPTGNTLSAETIAIPVANLFYQTPYVGGYLSVQCLSSNNFILYFADGYGNMQYAFFNSSGTCVSGSNSTGAIPLQVTGGFCGKFNRVTLLESGGHVNAYWIPATNQQKPTQQFYCRISTSNYLVTPFSSVAGTPYTVSGVTAGAIIPSTVNPSSASFYSTTSQSFVATNTPATVSGPTAIVPTTANSIASCTLPNGNFVVVYKISSAITANVYSPTGAIVTTISAGTGTTNDYAVKVAALSGGGFVVQYITDSTTLKLDVYSSGYGLTASTSFTIHSFATQYNFDISGLQDNKFVIFYSTNGTNSNVRVYDSTLTVLQNIPVTTYSTMQGLSIAGNAYGGFGFCYFSSSYGQSFFHSYVPTNTNTWTVVTNGTGTGIGDAFVQNPQMCATESGVYIFPLITSSYPSYGMWIDSGSMSAQYVAGLSTNWPNGLGSTSNPTSYPMMGVGMTGNGNVVIATSYIAQNIGFACLPAQMTFSNGQPLPFETSSNQNVPMFSPNAYNPAIGSTLSAQPRVTSGAGNNAIITFLGGAANYPSFIIINGTSLSSVYGITVGVTPSALTPISPATTSSNITGVLAGVAVTSATAGSTGQLAVGGQVLLGSSYTSTATGAFDSTGAAVSGVRGTFNGRSVNIQGNT